MAEERLTFNIDNTLENADWIKQSSFDFSQPDNRDAVEDALNIPKRQPERNQRLRSLAKLPVMKSAPQWLKDEVANLDSGSKWLGRVTGQ